MSAAWGRDGNWQNSITAPNLVSPVLLVIDRNTKLTDMPDYDRVGCQGEIYRFSLPFDQDAVVTMGDDLSEIEYPVWVYGGRNVVLRGLEMRPKVQDGCDVGEAHQVRDLRPNIHPRLVGNKALQLTQSGTTYLEGIDIDLNGQEADCFVGRNPDYMTASEVKAKRNFVIVNSRCVGIEGLSHSPIGDGIHGDFFQNQGQDDMGSLMLENVTYKSSSNGVTLHGWNGKNNWPRNFTMKNVNYGWDLRFSSDSRYEIFGLAFTVSADVVDVDNVWLDHGEGLNYGKVGDQRVGAVAKSGYIIKLPGLNEGKPPAGDFAPANRTGKEYKQTTSEAQTSLEPELTASEPSTATSSSNTEVETSGSSEELPLVASIPTPPPPESSTQQPAFGSGMCFP